MAITDYVTGVQHIGIPTNDLDKTIEFYKNLGFNQKGLFLNKDSRCAFMELGNLIIETWEGDVVGKVGAINHISLNTTNVKKSFEEVKAKGCELIDQEIQSIPSFWENGIKYFNILGPNQEIIEFCQIL